MDECDGILADLCEEQYLALVGGRDVPCADGDLDDNDLDILNTDEPEYDDDPFAPEFELIEDDKEWGHLTAGIRDGRAQRGLRAA